MKKTLGTAPIGGDRTKLPMELMLMDHMGQFLHRCLAPMLRQAKECHVDKPGFFVVEFSTTHLSQTKPTCESFWFDKDSKDAEGLPEPIRLAHIRQFEAVTSTATQVQYCVFLFHWRKEQLQQSILFSLPDLLEHKDADRTQHEMVDKLMAAQTVKDFVQKRFARHHKNLFACDNVCTPAYRWCVGGHTVGNLLHMVAMHGRLSLCTAWSSLETLRTALQELGKGRDVRIHLVLDRKSVHKETQSLEAAQGTAVGVVVYAYQHVEAKTHVELLFAHVDAEHSDDVCKTLYTQLAEFGTHYSVDHVAVHVPSDATDLYSEWWKANESVLRSAFGKAS